MADFKMILDAFVACIATATVIFQMLIFYQARAARIRYDEQYRELKNQIDAQTAWLDNLRSRVDAHAIILTDMTADRRGPRPSAEDRATNVRELLEMNTQLSKIIASLPTHPQEDSRPTSFERITKEEDDSAV